MTTDDRLADEAIQEWLGEGTTRSRIITMNSSAWSVFTGAERYVLKIADASEEAGLRVAGWLDERGFRTGAPAEMVVRGDRLVALLRFVDGRQLANSEADAEILGETLGASIRS